MIRNSEFLTIFGIKSLDFFSGAQCCNEMSQFVDALASIIFQVTVEFFGDRIVRSANAAVVLLIVE